MSFTKEEAEAQVSQLMEEQRWDEALQVCRRVVDELHVWPQQLAKVLYHVKPDAEQLRAEDTGSSMWLLGCMHYYGRVVQRDYPEAFHCFSRAWDKGHLLGRLMMGLMIAYGVGVPEDRARGFALMAEAAEAGCPQAFSWAGKAYSEGSGVQQSYHRAAQWYLKAGTRGGSHNNLTNLLRDRPLECAPFGEWRPELTPLVPREIREAMRATMLVCKRMQVPHGVAMLIVPYVCTEGEEWEQLLRETRGE